MTRAPADRLTVNVTVFAHARMPRRTAGGGGPGRRRMSGGRAVAGADRPGRPCGDLRNLLRGWAFGGKPYDGDANHARHVASAGPAVTSFPWRTSGSRRRRGFARRRSTTPVASSERYCRPWSRYGFEAGSSRDVAPSRSTKRRSSPGATLPQVHEMDRDAALLEEPQRGARGLRILVAEQLDRGTGVLRAGTLRLTGSPRLAWSLRLAGVVRRLRHGGVHCRANRTPPRERERPLAQMLTTGAPSTEPARIRLICPPGQAHGPERRVRRGDASANALLVNE